MNVTLFWTESWPRTWFRYMVFMEYFTVKSVGVLVCLRKNYLLLSLTTASGSWEVAELLFVLYFYYFYFMLYLLDYWLCLLVATHAAHGRNVYVPNMKFYIRFWKTNLWKVVCVTIYYRTIRRPLWKCIHKWFQCLTF